MNMTVRKIKFWGRLCLESLGYAVVISFLFLLFMGGSTGNWEGILPVYSYYLLLVGALLLAVMGITYMQVYAPVILSLNATRKEAAGGIFCCILGLVTGILLIMAVLWHLVPGEISASGKRMMPLFTGGLFIIAAISLLIGTAAVRWRKTGKIMAAIICAIAGAGTGMTVVFINKGSTGCVLFTSDGNFRILAGVGVLVYLAAGIFVSRALRKLEVRA